ncbi:mechanosensitive ion channel family protein [Desulforhopalus singaporensis]|uniref:Small conductance mechanosensitive channel n=1 Tax=Desulforhopalus singaporensis TaxID=91360 RepID=A0A1H0QAD4_9BACT|nr:mechanosensitive ion channel domain-containing protein [Desulforhopalus singaporensis]SDP14140.1 small conductance mechanosensitive channel [Desulforhopalus singaporensis]
MNLRLDMVNGELLKNMQPVLLSWGGKIVAALLVFLIGKWVASRITILVVKILEKKNVDVTLIRFLRGIIYYALLIAVLIAAAGQLGIQTTSFLAILGAASLAVGLALKDSLANFSSGVMLILFRPFRVGDWVQVGSEAGTVQEISVFSTILHTGDNQKKIIPNGAIANNTITNVTANATRRIDLVIGISYDDDIDKAKQVLAKILDGEKRILPEPAPLIAVSALADSSVNLAVRPWVRTADYWSVYFSLTETIKKTFDEENITIPYPQRDIHLHGQNG